MTVAAPAFAPPLTRERMVQSAIENATASFVARRQLDRPATTRRTIPSWARPLQGPARHKGASGGRSSGKCLGRGTLVMMADGSLRPVEVIRTGDCVMGPDSKPRTVLGTTFGVAPLYEIRQCGAMTYVANGAHVLALKRSASSRADHGVLSEAGNPQRPNGRYAKYGVDTTLIPVEEFVSKPARFKCHVFGFKAPVEFPAQPVPVDPYLFGLWLGDGDSARPAFTTADPEVADYVTQFAAAGGLTVRNAQTRSKARHLLLATNWRRDGILSVFRNMGVLGNKHIPASYLYNDTASRFALLAGLIDTDGHVTPQGNVSITLVSRQLIDGVKRLADGLGFATGLTAKNMIVTGEPYRAWVLSIGGDTYRIPCRIARKRQRLDAKVPTKNWRHSALRVSLIGEGEYYGFELDGDHLFLLADGTVTHNSHFFAEEAVEAMVRDPSLRVVCIREVQRSLKFSAKSLIENKIRDLEVSSLFEILATEIRRRNGTGVMIFEGMQDHTAGSIKSLEGFGRAWVEEAQSISKRSLDLLLPTIRAEGSELWFSWNPDQPTDPVDAFFASKPAGAVHVHTTYQENPFCPEVMRTEAARLQLVDPDAYAHIWDGGYFLGSSGRVYSSFSAKPFPVGNVDESVEDKGGEIYVGQDFNVNPMASVIAVRVVDECHVIDALEIATSNTSEVAEEIKRRYPGRKVIFCPDPAGNQRRTNAPVGQTDFTILRAAGFEVRAPTAHAAVVDRINNSQEMFFQAVPTKANPQSGRRRIRIHPRATALITALSNLTYKEGTSIRDTTRGGGAFLHITDACDYLLWQEFNVLVVPGKWGSSQFAFGRKSA